MSANRKHADKVGAAAEGPAEGPAEVLSLRDEFIKAALTGLVSLSHPDAVGHVAGLACAYADAVLAARDAGEPGEDDQTGETPKENAP